MPVERVADIAKTLIDRGVTSLSLGDTIGVGTPGHVLALLGALRERGIPTSQIAMHFHDTYGQALSNVYASLTAGVSEFDSSAGGLGRCPYAKGATGNLATEDLVWMLHGLGIDTGIDLDSLTDTSSWMARTDRPLEPVPSCHRPPRSTHLTPATQAPHLAQAPPCTTPPCMTLEKTDVTTAAWQRRRPRTTEPTEQQTYLEVWGDTVNGRHLAISVAVGSVVGAFGPSRGPGTVSNGSSANRRWPQAYSLLVGIAACLLAGVVCGIFIKPKRIVALARRRRGVDRRCHHDDE